MKILALITKIWQSHTAKTIILKVAEIALERLKKALDKPTEDKEPTNNEVVE